MPVMPGGVEYLKALTDNEVRETADSRKRRHFSVVEIFSGKGMKYLHKKE
jgi:hypothetical protein